MDKSLGHFMKSAISWTGRNIYTYLTNTYLTKRLQAAHDLFNNDQFVFVSKGKNPFIFNTLKAYLLEDTEPPFSGSCFYSLQSEGLNKDKVLLPKELALINLYLKCLS